jgi:hypothetical protein
MATFQDIFAKNGNNNTVADPAKAPKKSGMKKILLVAGIAILFGSLGSTYYFYSQWKKARLSSEIPGGEQAAEIIRKVSSFMELPNNEEPTVATVKDIEKLRSQPFFANANNGDVALVYSKSGKAILYRPSTNKIIEVAPLYQKSAADQSQEPIQAQPENSNDQENNNIVQEEVAGTQKENTKAPEENIVAKQVKVAVYNGANIKGLAQSIADKISGIQGVEITEKINAKNKYGKTLIVDLTGNNSELIQKIIETVGGEAGSLPDGETKPVADILIIGGMQ